MTSHPNRSRRTWQSGDTVYLRDESDLGEERVRQFWVPPGGGYVRETDDEHPGTLGQQVCDLLSSRGPTLWTSPDGLIALIRLEYRRALSAERRWK
ncbi:MAG TPA: hypothetical protein VNE67_17235 [Acetobacteraceae bacterium]|nr:hypothetical protein [Stellaceae bacterium]HVB69595.1 hypothetical protein [Acetobacteraceae bacterium]